MLSSCSFVVASSVGSADQTLPAINVKYDFPSSSTVASAKGMLDDMNRDATFAKRVQHMQLKTQHLSSVLRDFEKHGQDQLNAVLSIVQPTANKLESDTPSPYFLQLLDQKQRVPGVGMNDVEALAQDAESASEIYLSTAKSRPTPQDEQRSVIAGNVEALKAINAELLHEKHTLEESNGLLHCAKCERDHDQLCPDGWSELANGHCSGPNAYDGPCMAFAQFNGLSTNDKIEYERACQVCWPCSSA